MSLLDKLKAHNAKKQAENKEKFKQLGEKFKRKKTDDTVPEESASVTSVDAENKVSEKSANPVIRAIENSTESIKAGSEKMRQNSLTLREKTKKLREERPQRIAEAKEKARLQQEKINRINPRTKNIINWIFIGVSMLLGVLTIKYDIFPGSLFSDLHSGQDFRKKEMVIALETAIVIFLILFPVHYVILKRLANKQTVQDEADSDL